VKCHLYSQEFLKFSGDGMTGSGGGKVNQGNELIVGVLFFYKKLPSRLAYIKSFIVSVFYYFLLVF
jgi:hypothetical protein